MIYFDLCEDPTRQTPQTFASQTLFPAFNHNDMIPKSGLDFHVFRVCQSAGLKVESRLLECRVQVASRLPSQCATWTGTLADRIQNCKKTYQLWPCPRRTPLPLRQTSPRPSIFRELLLSWHASRSESLSEFHHLILIEVVIPKCVEH
jgi:hypothetical protein